MEWITVEDEFVTSDERGYAVWDASRSTWRYVDDGTVADEIDWTVGMCGYRPCVKYAIAVTSNTVDALVAGGYIEGVPAVVPHTRWNAGIPPLTPVGSSRWGWVDWALTIVVLFVIFLVIRRR